MTKTVLRFLVSPCRVNLGWMPYAICICGFVLMMLLFYPGVICPDSFSQFNQIEEGVLTDWHPPIMAATWQWIREAGKAITGIEILGNGVLWTLYSSFIWLGLLLILHSGRSFWKNAGQKSYLFIGLIVFCLLWSLLDLFDDPRVLMKDTGFLGTYLMATGLLLNVPKTKWYRVFYVLIVLFFVFYGTALRHNAIFSAIPLLCWLVWTLLPQKRIGLVVPVSILLWLAMLAGIHYVNYGLIKAVRLYSLSEIFFLDIWQLNARTPHYVRPPNTFGNDFTSLDEKTFRSSFRKDSLFVSVAFSRINDNAAPVKGIYHFSNWSLMPSDSDRAEFVERANKRKDMMGIGNGVWSIYSASLHFETSLSEAQKQFPEDYNRLKKAWMERILMDPVTYLKFKTRFFIGFCKNKTLYFGGLNAMMLLPVLLFLIAGLTFSRNNTNPGTFPCLMLAWSALFYILPLWLFLPDDEPIRYLLWFFAASFISITYFLAHSPLFAEILQTVQRYLERKADGG